MKTILVTGATSGFGEAIARRFASDGWKLVVLGRRQDRLVALARELKAHALVCDVRRRKEVFEAVASLPKEFATVDVLVNNAGLALGMEPAHKADLDDWEQMVDTNIKGLMFVTRAVLPGMVERGRGHIVNMGSTASNYPYPGGNAYGGSKAFVKQFSLNLRADLSGTGVRVTNLEPGLAETEFSLVRFKGDQDKAAAVYKGMQPLTGQDIAEACAWCVNLPAHVNVNRMEIMPTAQSFGPFAVHRKT
ncbi:MAG: SDR family oxidoreductase [Planctomycetaceae bacterium]|nr:NADP-dependent 3-hydroxy acid dehydrogenase YdfG [Planctomycetota bacterium]MCQ3950664.1 NAD(P)-dependent oxidoreductase [Planctomycetota bacterium]NUO17337.1 SDR family oxidoreductase [Planctomycetaceae bacterium]GIK51644.1 MAG: NAD(P)-dependent oxidoreductase [Planctomycetota bacterium]HRJ77567.1 SDR family oxidoreductase [Planctomycetota bacterium]